MIWKYLNALILLCAIHMVMPGCSSGGQPGDTGRDTITIGDLSLDGAVDDVSLDMAPRDLSTDRIDDVSMSDTMVDSTIINDTAVLDETTITDDVTVLDNTLEPDDALVPEDTSITGTIIINVTGLQQEITVGVEGPVEFDLTTTGGLAMQIDVPEGTYVVDCPAVPDHELAVTTADDTINVQGEVITFTCAYTDVVVPITGTILINIVGITKNVDVTITGPGNYNLTSAAGIVTQSGVPEGTYAVDCETLGGYTHQVQTADGTIDNPGEVITFTCTYTFAPAWVAVGQDGPPIVWSVDGILWSEPMGPTDKWIRDIAYGPNRYLAVGVGATLTSEHGLDWDPGTNPGKMYEYTGVTYGESRFVIVDSAQSWYSFDGTSWTESTPSPNPCIFADVCWGNERFVAVGGNIANNSEAFYSNNGSSWVQATVDGKRLNAVTWVEGPMGFFVAVGQYGGIHWSFDGGGDWEWNDVTEAGGDLYGVAAGDGHIVAVGEGGRILYASKGGPGNWTDASIGGGDLMDVAYGDGKFIAVGAGGRRLVSETNGQTWTLVASGGPYLYSILYKP